MSIVYIISTYDEYGAENVVATLDKSRVPLMLEENWPSEGPQKSEDLACLVKILLKPDVELLARRDGYNLSKGWGGFQLHVVKLT
jgi:hypothetical protein